jgi:peptide/nickel transport system ATP-binding protein
LLRRLQKERGLSLLFITHNLALVRSIAQDLVVLHEGRIVESGLAAQVLAEPQDDYTVRLLEDVPKLSSSAGAGPEVSAPPESVPAGTGDRSSTSAPSWLTCRRDSP